MTHFLFNRNRQTRVDEDGNVTPSPYRLAFGEEHKEHLVAFGTGAYVLDERVTRGQKFRPRSVLMAIVGYGPGGSYKLVDVQKLKDTGRLAIVTSKELRIQRGGDAYGAPGRLFRTDSYRLYPTLKQDDYHTIQMPLLCDD